MGIGLIPGSIPVIGTAVAAVTGPLGIAVGLGISWCINITMGAGLVLLLLYEGMFYPHYLFPGFIAEIIPGINDLPFWMLIVVLCIIKKTGEEAEGVLGTAARVAAGAALIASNPASVRGTAATLQSVRRIRQPESSLEETEEPQQQTRVPLNLKSPTINSDILPHAQAA